jgi:protein TonB
MTALTRTAWSDVVTRAPSWRRRAVGLFGAIAIQGLLLALALGFFEHPASRPVPEAVMVFHPVDQERPLPDPPKPEIALPKFALPPIQPIPVPVIPDPPLVHAESPHAITLAPPPPPPPPASHGAPAPTDLFMAALRGAIQGALRYPNSARTLHLSGKVLVGFHYADGRVWNCSVVTSSGFEILDRAALEAVREADLPRPPQELAGKELALAINVDFSRLAGAA